EAKPFEPETKSAGPARAGMADGPGKGAGSASSVAARSFAAPWLSHLASGALGAIIVLIVVGLMTSDKPAAPSREMGDLARRLTDLEGALGTRPGAGLRARIEELGRSIGALGDTQAKLARDTKTLDDKVGATPEFPPE